MLMHVFVTTKAFMFLEYLGVYLTYLCACMYMCVEIYAHKSV